MDGSSGDVTFDLHDCTGVGDDYEATYTSSTGYVRMDTFHAGDEAGNFSGDPLQTTMAGYVSVSSADGVTVTGDYTLRQEVTATDAEDAACVVSDGDEDDDGHIDDTLGGDDCDDTDPSIHAGAEDPDDDGIDSDCDGTWESPYKGGWPVNQDKEDIPDPGLPGSAEEGSILARFILPDQFGQEVDIYDFAGNGRPILIMGVTMWSSPDGDWADWLLGLSLRGPGSDDWGQVPQLIADGELTLVTLVLQDSDVRSASVKDAIDWAAQHPHELVPVLADVGGAVNRYLKPESVPVFLYASEDMEILGYDSNQSAGLDAAQTAAD